MTAFDPKVAVRVVGVDAFQNALADLATVLAKLDEALRSIEAITTTEES